MQRASGALHLVHRVERRSMLKLRLVPGGKDGAAIGHGARCSVGSEWGSAVGGVAFGPPCASVSVNTAKARCCCRFTPTNPESAPSASRSPLAVHQARFSGPETGASSRKMPRSQPGHNGHGGFVWLSLGNDHVFSDRWNDGLRRRIARRNRTADL